MPVEVDDEIVRPQSDRLPATFHSGSISNMPKIIYKSTINVIHGRIVHPQRTKDSPWLPSHITDCDHEQSGSPRSEKLEQGAEESPKQRVSGMDVVSKRNWASDGGDQRNADRDEGFGRPESEAE